MSCTCIFQWRRKKIESREGYQKILTSRKKDKNNCYTYMSNFAKSGLLCVCVGGGLAPVPTPMYIWISEMFG